MYFVTIKRADFVLFAMSPSERFAIGLTEQQNVRLFTRDPSGGWTLLHEWDARRYSHTEFMSSLHRVDEPADPKELLSYLPAEVR